jgi:hypothetical protein
MHGSTSLGRQSTQCGRDLPHASPWLQLLLEHSSGSGGTVNAPFGHPLHVTERPTLLV